MSNGQIRDEEQFALQTLKNIFPSTFSKSLTNLDSPDLQDPIKDIGIEIARCLLSTQGQINGFLKEYSGRSKDDIPSKKIEKLISLGHKPFWFNNELHGVFSPVYAPTPCTLLDTVQQKIEKLQMPGFKKFSSNRLFLFVWQQIGIYTHWQMHEFIQKINAHQRQKIYKFDVVYVFDSYHNGYDLWICYLNTNYVRKIRIEFSSPQ